MNSRGPARGTALGRAASNTIPTTSASHATASGTTTSASVRRNLFPQARRQLQHTPSSSSTPMTSLSTVRDHNGPTNNDSTSNDIIVRDAITGQFTLDTPTIPPVTDEDLEDEEEEARRRIIEGWRKHGGGMVEQSGESLSFSTWLADKEGVDKPVDLEIEVTQISKADESQLDAEIRAVLLASLDSKVQSLEEDGWMFGDEEKEEDQ
jgi:hypothetical protein